MSGSAALSAARKRRASSAQMGGGGGGNTNTQSQSASYYGGSKQSLQGIMNQVPVASYPNASINHQVPPAYVLPKENVPTIPINIYENIELIKQQLTERTRLIQTQGSSIPPDKLRVLQKQNEIQTQVLRQKIMIAQQMEAAEQQKQLELKQQYEEEILRINQLPVNPNEPEFFYEKGIPRRNPRYKKPEEVKPLGSVPQYMGVGEPTNQPQHSRDPRLNSGKEIMKPFVSMITDTGVIPPPIVILKSHDATLADHHYLLQELVSQIDDLQSKTESIISASETQAAVQASEQQTSKDIKSSINNGPEHGSKNESEAEPNADADEDEENVLLMDEVMNDLTNSREFIEGIVDKIVNETNLSEVIMKIEPIIKENQELRSLIFSQQQMMNEMNMLLFRLMNEQQKMNERSQEAQHVTNNNVEFNHAHDSVMEVANEIEIRDEGLNDNGLYLSDMTEVILSEPIREELEETITPVVNEKYSNEQPSDEQPSHEQPSHEQPSDEQPSDEQPSDEQPSDEQPSDEQSSKSDHDANAEESEMKPISPIDDDYNDICSEPVSLIVSELLENAY